MRQGRHIGDKKSGGEVRGNSLESDTHFHEKSLKSYILKGRQGFSITQEEGCHDQL